MDDFSFLILRAATTIIAAVVAYYVVPLLKQTIDRLEDEKLRDFIRRAVYAAQQTMTDNLDKFSYVEKQALLWLDEHGVSLTQEQLKILIESAVLTMKSETR